MSSRTDELRIAVVFRADLDMPRGKSEVQFGHAMTMLIAKYDLVNFVEYFDSDHMKLSMEVDGLSDIEDIAFKAEKRAVPFAIVTDAGRTVFAEPTITCIGIGPMNKTDCNALTRNARMRT